MNVHPHLFHHPKFVRLVQVVGRPALDHLARLWAFCQQDHRGENLGKVSSHYVEQICQWSGEEGKLWQALTEEFTPGKKGFVHLDGRGNVIVTSWNEHNHQLVSNWRNGEKKRREAEKVRREREQQQRKASAEAVLKQRKASAEAPVKPLDGMGCDVMGLDVTGNKDSHTPGVAPASMVAEWPLEKEWLEYCALIGLPEWKAKQEWLNQERARPKWKGIGKWQAHASWVRQLWEDAGRPGPTAARMGQGSGAIKKSAASERWTLQEEKKALETAIAEHAANPNSTAHDPQASVETKQDYLKKTARLRELGALLAKPQS